MNDLIDRQQAIEALTKVPGIGNRALDRIRELPSAQPEPIKLNIDHELSPEEVKKLKKKFPDTPIVLLPERKTGHWVFMGKPRYFKCSECGNTIDILNEEFCNYCPNCGAKMEVEHE